MACCGPKRGTGRLRDGVPVKEFLSEEHKRGLLYKPWEMSLDTFVKRFFGPLTSDKPLRVHPILGSQDSQINIIWPLIVLLCCCVLLQALLRNVWLISWPAKIAIQTLTRVSVAWKKDRVRTLSGLRIGVVTGLFLSLLKFWRMSRRRTVANALQLIPGVEYVRSVLGSVPDWVTLREHERCAWVNRILDDAWRFFDKAISDRLAEWVLPELEKFKPPFIHSIEFKRISCGGVPFTVEHISVSSWTHEDIVLEVDAAWNSDADIQLLIQTTKGLGKHFASLGSLLVKVLDITFKGRVRLILKPLVPAIPFVGGFSVSFIEVPLIRYRPVVSGGVTAAATAAAAPVITWLSNLITEKVVTNFVWPERLSVDISAAVPELRQAILAKDPNWGSHKLEPKVMGCLEVIVLSAEGLATGSEVGPMSQLAAEQEGDQKRKRKLGAYVGLFVRHNQVLYTSTKPRASPAWGERFRFLIKESAWEKLHLEMHTEGGALMGRGIVHLKHLEQLIRDGSLMGSTSHRGEAASPLARRRVSFAGSDRRERAAGTATSPQAEGKRLAVPLGPLDFALGCGSGLGMLNLECSFTPSSSSRESKVGALVVRIFSVRRLPKMDLIGWCNPYVAVSLSGGSRASRGQGRGRGKRRTDTTVTRTVRDFNSVAHYWKVFEFFDVNRDETLSLVVMDADKMSRDEEVGKVTIPVRSVIESEGCTLEKRFQVEDGPGKRAGTELEARLVWAGHRES